MIPSLALSALLCLPATQEATEAPVYMGRAFLFQADLEAARALRWVEPEVTDEEILKRVEETLRARTRNSGRFVEAQVAAEPDAVFSVTFVGPMANAIEEMLIDGLSRPAHVELVTLATDADLDGTTVNEERERLRVWLAADETRQPGRFVTVPREAGGPHPRLAWAPPRERTAEDLASDALPVLRDQSLLIRRGELERAVGVRGSDERAMALALRPGEDLQALFAARLAGEGQYRYLVDGVAVDEARPLESYEEIKIGSFTLDELRGLILGVAGEPLCAPLTFIGRDSRPLKNVVIHVPGDDD